MANEKRLIDFEKARLSVLEILQGKVTASVAVKVACAMKREIVDAVEVVHGEWDVITDDCTFDVIYQCSVCKEEFVTNDGTPAENLWHYCPNCGAKMDGDGNV